MFKQPCHLLLGSVFKLFVPTGYLSDIGKLIFLATVIAGFFLFTASIYYDPDSVLYIGFVNAILHGKEAFTPEDASRYDITYPLLLILSGYPFLHSLIGMALLNTLMSILMPVLIYFTVRSVLPRGAYYIALATIISLSPFYYIKLIRPDHAYMFFSVLSICLLSLFIDTKRFIFLYAMIVAVIVASWVRPAGNIFFFFFITMAFLFGRGRIQHFVICILIGLIVFSSYFHFRHQLFKGDRNFNGGQTFYNLYVNSKEFGIRLSPELGPAMKTITNNLYQAAIDPSSKYISREDFPLSAKELIDQIYDDPSVKYYLILYSATPHDSLFLKASWEIMRRYPWYPFAYTARNIWHLLYDPGFTHSRSSDHLVRAGIQDVLSFDAVPMRAKNLFPRAMREIKMDSFANKSKLTKQSLDKIKYYYCLHYLKLTKLMFYFMAMVWIAIVIHFISRLTSSKKIQFMADLLPKKFMPLAVILSLFLFLNIFIVALFVDPLLRFHNHIIPFKIMLAGLGASILLHVVYQMGFPYFPFLSKAHSLITTLQSNTQLKQYKTKAFSLILMVIILFASWSSFILIYTRV